MTATAAVAVNRPTPGMSEIRRHASSQRRHSIMRCSIRWICSSSASSRDSWSCKPSVSIAGNWSARSAKAILAAAIPVRRPCGSTTPNSYNSPRNWFTCITRKRTSCWRMRWSASMACCSSVLTATNRIPGRCAASQIAAASAVSFLLDLTNGRTNWAAISRTSCPSADNFRAQ